MNEYIKAEPPYYFRYRKVWIKHNGLIPKGMMIHHINGNKQDDRIENLKIVSRKEHGKEHQLPNRIRIKYPSGAICVKKVINI